MAKHTPGPWMVRQDRKFSRLAEVVRADGTAFDEAYFLSSPEDMANAHLIAAAPEMLKALRLIEAQLGQKSISFVDLEAVLTYARRQIAKAEGR